MNDLDSKAGEFEVYCITVRFLYKQATEGKKCGRKRKRLGDVHLFDDPGTRSSL